MSVNEWMNDGMTTVSVVWTAVDADWAIETEKLIIPIKFHSISGPFRWIE